ncbi:MAG: isocitrate dehydrogenase (NADP(+)) [Deltaproteobacteria bacterium]|nr:isocitrate dehydrogenase (NADP(+)) [Deltaproteobacteria bacterium]
MAKYKKLTPPTTGSKITIAKDKSVAVPNDPVIPFIEGDGTGPDIWRASQFVFDAAVQKAYGGKRRIVWFEVFAGDKANDVYGPNTWLPDDTLKAIKDYVVAIKGPLTTPVGEGIRSINVTLRQVLDLYACVRPVRWFQGVPAPVSRPGDLDVVIFRENTEDVYSGIEYASGKPETKQIIQFINKVNGKKGGSGKKVDLAAGVGIKPITKKGTQRLVRKAIQYAIDKGRPSVSIVHKGNIMKFTEGAFRNWGYEVAKKEFRKQIVTWDEVQKEHGGKVPAGKILVQDVIADNMFQQLLLRPTDYSVLATPNLNGDYLSDAAAAQVGGLGIAPGANIGDKAAVFEATHGTAPKYAGQDKVNPGSVILSGVMMFEYMGWDRAAQLITAAMEKTISEKTVTYDFERQMQGAKLLKCSEFGKAVAKNMDAVIGSINTQN